MAQHEKPIEGPKGIPDAGGKDQPTHAAGRVTGSNYETPAERAIRRAFEEKKHKQIGKQGSINSAIAFLQAVNPKGIPNDVTVVLAVAKQFNEFAFSETVADLADDIPF